MKDNLSENVVQNGNAGYGTTSQSRIRSTALLVGEPLAKPETLQGVPKPLLPGEVSPKVTERLYQRELENNNEKALPHAGWGSAFSVPYRTG